MHTKSNQWKYIYCQWQTVANRFFLGLMTDGEVDKLESTLNWILIQHQQWTLKLNIFRTRNRLKQQCFLRFALFLSVLLHESVNGEWWMLVVCSNFLSKCLPVGNSEFISFKFHLKICGYDFNLHWYFYIKTHPYFRRKLMIKLFIFV